MFFSIEIGSQQRPRSTAGPQLLHATRPLPKDKPHPLGWTHRPALPIPREMTHRRRGNGEGGDPGQPHWRQHSSRTSQSGCRGCPDPLGAARFGHTHARSRSPREEALSPRQEFEPPKWTKAQRRPLHHHMLPNTAGFHSFNALEESHLNERNLNQASPWDPQPPHGKCRLCPKAISCRNSHWLPFYTDAPT